MRERERMRQIVWGEEESEMERVVMLIHKQNKLYEESIQYAHKYVITVRRKLVIKTLIRSVVQIEPE